jgi:hypothetical protein
MIESTINRFVTTPTYLFNQADSSHFALVIGGTYGLLGRAVFPQKGINPINYAIWFVVAFQIKKLIQNWETQLSQNLNSDAAPNEHKLLPRIRQYYRSGRDFKDMVLNKVDTAVCFLFGLRPYDQITKENVQDALFLEMCRFRLWNVFKSTIIDNASFAIARTVTHQLGFTLPSHTSIPVFLATEVIIRNIVCLPLIYKYMDFSNRLEIDVSPVSTPSERASVFKQLLPAL